LLLPDEKTPSAQYGTFCSCIQEQDFDNYKSDEFQVISLEEVDFIQEKAVHSYSIWNHTNDIPWTLTSFGQRDPDLPPGDKPKASLLYRDKQSLKIEKSFCPGTAYLQMAALLALRLG